MENRSFVLLIMILYMIYLVQNLIEDKRKRISQLHIYRICLILDCFPMLTLIVGFILLLLYKINLTYIFMITTVILNAIAVGFCIFKKSKKRRKSFIVYIKL